MTAATNRLPTGRAARAAYSKDDVTRHQRERILRALASVVAESSYVSTSVSQVIGRAGVSRATFYEQFSDKQDCFLAAYDLALEILLATATGDGPPPGSDPITVFGAFLRRYLDAIAAEPELARVFLLDVYALGPAGVAHRAAGQVVFVDALVAVFGTDTPQRRFAAELMVAGVGSLVTARLADGDLDGLRDLHGPVVGAARGLLVT